MIAVLPQTCVYSHSFLLSPYILTTLSLCHPCTFLFTILSLPPFQPCSLPPSVFPTLCIYHSFFSPPFHPFFLPLFSLYSLSLYQPLSLQPFHPIVFSSFLFTTLSCFSVFTNLCPQSLFFYHPFSLPPIVFTTLSIRL